MQLEVRNFFFYSYRIFPTKNNKIRKNQKKQEWKMKKIFSIM